MKKLFVTIACAMLMCACGRDTLADEERTFDGGVWNRFTPEVYTIDVENADEYYNIDLMVSVDTALMRGTTLPLTVNLYSPDGERRMFYSSIALVKDGRWRGESVVGHAGRRMVTGRIRAFFTFNRQGEHRLEICQATSQYDLEGIHTLHLTIEKADLPEIK